MTDVTLRKRIAALLGVVLLAVLALGTGGIAVAAPVTAVVDDLRVGEHAAKTRLVLGVDKPIPFNVFTLADPYRVVIDLPEVGWRLPSRPLPRDTGLLKQLRYGLFKPGVSRVVLDVKGPTAVSQAMLLQPDSQYGYRLVIDMAGTSRAAFLSKLKADPVVAATAQVAGRAPLQAKAPKPAAKPKPMQTAAVAFPPPPRKPAPRARAAKRVVAIDAGHGGVDPGTVGTSGIYEKHITLSTARELKKRLEATGRYKVVLTRERDVFIRLRKRVERARKEGAELFLSLHADAIKNKRIRGLSVYTLSERASDKEAALLAEKENKADLIAGVNLSDEAPEVANILIDLAQRETMNQSAHFATGMVGELKREVSLLRNTHRFAGFAVLKAPDIPSVLVELGFLSNRQDEKNLRSKAYRAKLARAMVRAIDRYFERVEEASRL